MCKPHTQKSAQSPSSTLGRSSTSPSSTASPHSTPQSSRGSSHNPSSTPTSGPESLPQPEPSGDNYTERTQSELYESLLLGYKLGFPRWMPSPRRVSDGTFYRPEIGDVGFLSHGLSFNTLFNITQPSSPANRDEIPDGVDPPCPLETRDVSVNERFHSLLTTLSRPTGAISKPDVTPIAASFYSSIRDLFSNYTIHGVFTFHLPENEGALPP
ncbi:hypothetical protein PQX77_013387 [Marasmius sp. AFHP31]|nr:hypothetical protein PQX77_013387 [Marasmius sp. AFHP31]